MYISSLKVYKNEINCKIVEVESQYKIKYKDCIEEGCLLQKNLKQNFKWLLKDQNIMHAGALRYFIHIQTIDHLLRTHLQDQHANSLKITYFVLLKN